MTVAAVLLLLILQAISPSSPGKSGSPKASIEGVVLRIGSGDSIPDAEVTILKVPDSKNTDVQEQPLSSPSPRVRTDRQGRFAFRDLDPGDYRVTAGRNGYVKQEYGLRVAGGRGTIVSVTAGEIRKDLAFHLTPVGNVSGLVRDYTGEALPGLQVQLLRPVYNQQGQKEFQVVALARTNDRGEYRLYWVTPGRYTLRIASNPNELASGRSPNEVQSAAYPITYYPGTTDSAEASVINVQPGGELNTVDFVLASTELRYRVKGRVVNSSGKPLENVQIRIVPRKMDSSSYSPHEDGHYNSATGAFDFQDVQPGSYWVQADVFPDFEAPVATTGTRSLKDIFVDTLLLRPSGRAAVDVSHSDVDNIVVRVERGSAIPGRLAVENEELSAIGNLEKIEVELVSTTPGMDMQPPRAIRADGTFVLEGIQPGEYRLVVNLPESDLYLKDARMNSSDVLGQPFFISNAVAAALNITLSSKGGQVEGTLLDDQSNPISGNQVILVPDRSRGRTELFKAATTNDKGAFTIRAVAPGSYKLFAWEAMEDFAYFDPDFVRQFEQKGKAVTVDESSKVTVDVKIIPAPR